MLHEGIRGGWSIGPLPSTFDSIHRIDLILDTYNELSLYFQLIEATWCLIVFHGNHSHINDDTGGRHQNETYINCSPIMTTSFDVTSKMSSLIKDAKLVMRVKF